MSDRHEKWVRVEPGTVIPAGQPYAVEYDEPAFGVMLGQRLTRSEMVHPGANVEVDRNNTWFVDSSWKPPLVLPTEPTWGVAVRTDGSKWLSRWLAHGSRFLAMVGDLHDWPATSIADFIPLTDEQVARIEAAR